MTRDAWDKRQAHLTQWYHHVKGMSWDKALVEATHQTQIEHGPRPPAAETGKGPGLLRLGWGILFHREKTMDVRIVKPLKKALQGIVIGVGTLVAGYFVSPEFSSEISALPLVEMWGPVAGAAISGGILNLLQHLKQYKPQPK